MTDVKTIDKIDRILDQLWNVPNGEFERVGSTLKIKSATPSVPSSSQIGTSFVNEAPQAMKVMKGLVTATPPQCWILQLGNRGLPSPHPPNLVWTISTLTDAKQVDVISSSSHSLPFKDNVFHTILVFPGWFENHTTPTSLTQELIRVLQPGGKICSWAFPGEMVRLTATGWRSMFETASPLVQFHGVDSFEELHPMGTLRSYLRQWVSGLGTSPSAQQHFLGQTVQNLIQTSLGEARGWPSVTELTTEAKIALTETPVLFISKRTTAPQPLVINEAKYGKDNQTKDVTLLLQTRTSRDPYHIFLSSAENLNQIFGDPAPNVPKELVIRWSRGTETGISITPEFNGFLQLPIFL